jgi:hypothetical protein
MRLLTHDMYPFRDANINGVTAFEKKKFDGAVVLQM